MADRPRLKVAWFDEREQRNYAGYVEPPDQSWILFLQKDGSMPVLFRRDPRTGAILPGKQ